MNESQLNKMTGGPLDEAADAELAALRKLIASEPDVVALLGLQPLGQGRYLYLVATPYLYPAYALGITNADNTQVRVLTTTGAAWSARERWEELLKGGAEIEILQELEGRP